MKLVMFAPSSLSAKKSGGTPPPYAKKWGVTAVTPGLIAFCATLVSLAYQTRFTFKFDHTTSGYICMLS